MVIISDPKLLKLIELLRPHILIQKVILLVIKSLMMEIQMMRLILHSRKKLTGGARLYSKCSVYSILLKCNFYFLLWVTIIIFSIVAVADHQHYYLYYSICRGQGIRMTDELFPSTNCIFFNRQLLVVYGMKCLHSCVYDREGDMTIFKLNWLGDQCLFYLGPILEENDKFNNICIPQQSSNRFFMNLNIVKSLHR